jgi:putative addiction module killer protein
MLELRYCLDAEGRSPFARWFDDLDAISGAKVVRAPARIEQGNLSNVKGVGEGVVDYKIDFGPGYRVYFGRDGAQLVILLVGGTKKRQRRDIRAAAEYWRDYKLVKRMASRTE